MANQNFQNFYTVRQVRQILFSDTLSMTSLYLMVKKGDIPSVKYLNKSLIPGAWVRKEMEKAELI